MRVQVSSETSRLKTVLIHSPGAEFQGILPYHLAPALKKESGYIKNRDYLLYDDLLDPVALQEEHRVLKEVLECYCEEGQVLEVMDLAREVLESSAGRLGLLRELEVATSTPAEVKEFARLLDTETPSVLLEVLMTGLHQGEVIFRNPAPNMMFARDLMAVVGDRIILPYARHEARERDMALARTIVKHHLELSQVECVDIRAGDEWEEQAPAFEAGDLLVLNESVVVIGVGIRTNRPGAERIARELIAGGVMHVLLVELPRTRGAMHLDTVFTLIDRNTCIGFVPALSGGGGHPCPPVYHVTAREEISPLSGGVLNALEQIGVSLAVVPCGGGISPHQEREQWTDGANAVALDENNILLYRRNRKTLEALKSRGYDGISAEDFVAGVRSGEIKSDDDQSRVILLAGGELSRGRGGGRCLTMPLWRP